MNKYIYLSHPLNGNVPTYGNRDRIIIEPKSQIIKKETANSFSIRMTTNHIGTHIDLPSHFYNTVKNVVYYNPDTWIFKKIQLVDIKVETATLIYPKDLTGITDKKVELILIRTGYEKYRNEHKYWNDNPGLAPEMADYLRDKFPRLRAVGFDFISLTSWKHKEEGKKAHKNFLDPQKKEIFIIEDMRLSVVYSNQIINVLIIPWLIDTIDSAPVTVLANLK